MSQNIHPRDCRCESCLLQREAEDPEHYRTVYVPTATEVERHHNEKVYCQDCIALRAEIGELTAKVAELEKENFRLRSTLEVSHIVYREAK